MTTNSDRGLWHWFQNNEQPSWEQIIPWPAFPYWNAWPRGLSTCTSQESSMPNPFPPKHFLNTDISGFGHAYLSIYTLCRLKQEQRFLMVRASSCSTAVVGWQKRFFFFYPDCTFVTSCLCLIKPKNMNWHKHIFSPVTIPKVGRGNALFALPFSISADKCRPREFGHVLGEEKTFGTCSGISNFHQGSLGL